MNVLLCCCTGFSTSIMVKSMRKEAAEMGRNDIKIASVGTDQIYQYIYRADVVLVAPQLVHEYE
ncbi:MAG: PTS sugar transporter subunit IIB, partial [Coprobacillus cateniformis]